MGTVWWRSAHARAIAPAARTTDATPRSGLASCSRPARAASAFACGSMIGVRRATHRCRSGSAAPSGRRRSATRLTDPSIQTQRTSPRSTAEQRGGAVLADHDWPEPADAAFPGRSLEWPALHPSAAMPRTDLCRAALRLGTRQTIKTKHPTASSATREDRTGNDDGQRCPHGRERNRVGTSADGEPDGEAIRHKSAVGAPCACGGSRGSRLMSGRVAGC
jgi:hypothetical protein